MSIQRNPYACSWRSPSTGTNIPATSPRSAWWRMVPVAAVALLAGCATVTRGRTDDLIIQSVPTGARATIHPDGIHCTTPCTIALKRKKSYVVELHKDGFDSASVAVQPVTDGAGRAGMAGNILVGGLIGMGVDAATGAIKGLSPNPLQVMLLPTVPQPEVPVQVAAVAAPPAAASEPAGPGANCIQPSIVDREACLGRLQLGMSKAGIIVLLGQPDGTSRDGTTFRYGDRYLKFDAAEQLIRISDKPL